MSCLRIFPLVTVTVCCYKSDSRTDCALSDLSALDDQCCFGEPIIVTDHDARWSVRHVLRRSSLASARAPRSQDLGIASRPNRLISELVKYSPRSFSSTCSHGPEPDILTSTPCSEDGATAREVPTAIHLPLAAVRPTVRGLGCAALHAGCNRLSLYSKLTSTPSPTFKHVQYCPCFIRSCRFSNDLGLS